VRIGARPRTTEWDTGAILTVGLKGIACVLPFLDLLAHALRKDS
jgi:hypothetical protein